MNLLFRKFLIIVRKLYSICFLNKEEWRIGINASCHNVEQTSDYIYNLLMSNKPCMIARFGSTELACLVNYQSIKSDRHSVSCFIKGTESEWWWNQKIIDQMQNWSGFFPPTEDALSRFCELMISDIKELDVLGQWVEFEDRVKHLPSNVFLTHLHFLEPFWSKRPWTAALAGKSVVVVHPFSEEIKYQYDRRDLLFSPNVILPEFKLRVVKAVQSLGGTDNGFSNWFDALDWMIDEINKEPYDICLIGCGAYGFALAADCKRKGKKSIHLGGALQLLFGIRGKRWENELYGVHAWGIQRGAYTSLMNENWIRPNDVLSSNKQMVENGCYW